MLFELYLYSNCYKWKKSKKFHVLGGTQHLSWNVCVFWLPVQESNDLNFQLCCGMGMCYFGMVCLAQGLSHWLEFDSLSHQRQ